MGRIYTDKEFLSAWKEHGTTIKVSRALNMSERAVLTRRRSLENRYGIQLKSEDIRAQKYNHLSTAHKHKKRLNLGIRSGTVLIFSDAHFWPGIRTTAYKGLLWAIKEFKPKAIICNGDAFDGAGISRHPRIGWDSKPNIKEELMACEIGLGEIEEAVENIKPKTKLIWTLGNHDMRFESKLAANVPEFMAVGGFSLCDHFPKWETCWSVWLTDNVVVKHRYKGGVHATHNNTVTGGKSIVTGHLHSLKVTPYSDYNGTRFGIDTGTLAEIDGPQFSDYLEDSPVNWRSGFAVLTFHEGTLLWPELVHKFGENKIEFRGKVIDVSKI